MRSGWRECILSWGECEEKENQSWTISTVASKVAAFPQNRQKMFTDATNLATMVQVKRGYLQTRVDIKNTFGKNSFQKFHIPIHLDSSSDSI